MKEWSSNPRLAYRFVTSNVPKVAKKFGTKFIAKNSMLSPMKSPYLPRRKTGEVIIDLGVDEEARCPRLLPRKVPALAELAAKTSMGSTAPLSKSKNFRSRHKSKAPTTTTTKKRRRPGPKPLRKAEPPAPPKPRWRPMSQVVSEKQRELDEKTFRN